MKKMTTKFNPNEVPITNQHRLNLLELENKLLRESSMTVLLGFVDRHMTDYIALYEGYVNEVGNKRELEKKVAQLEQENSVLKNGKHLREI